MLQEVLLRTECHWPVAAVLALPSEQVTLTPPGSLLATALSPSLPFFSNQHPSPKGSCLLFNPFMYIAYLFHFLS